MDSEFILIPVSLGELVDKITILEIKISHTNDQKKIENISKELNLLQKVLDDCGTNQNQLIHYRSELHKINLKIWQLEDQIRFLHSNASFDENFISVAKQIYQTNDLRSKVKNQINIEFNSDIVEEKIYEVY
jgi:hypothetical protein